MEQVLKLGLLKGSGRIPMEMNVGVKEMPDGGCTATIETVFARVFLTQNQAHLHATSCKKYVRASQF